MTKYSKYRGCFLSKDENLIFTIVGNKVFITIRQELPIEIGEITTTDGDVFIDQTHDKICIVDSENAYIYEKGSFNNDINFINGTKIEGSLINKCEIVKLK